MKRLGTIALALGEERTRKELIPFLNASSEDDDEVLLAMAEELGNFVPYVGGSEYAHTLLVPLETLCCTEETVVREQAVKSLSQVGAELSASSTEEHLHPLVEASPAAWPHTLHSQVLRLLQAAHRASGPRDRVTGVWQHSALPVCMTGCICSCVAAAEACTASKPVTAQRQGHMCLPVCLHMQMSASKPGQQCMQLKSSAVACSG